MFVAISFATYRTNNRNYVSIVTITHTMTTNTTYINKPITKTYIYIYINVCIRMYIHVYIYIYICLSTIVGLNIHPLIMIIEAKKV